MSNSLQPPLNSCRLPIARCEQSKIANRLSFVICSFVIPENCAILAGEEVRMAELSRHGKPWTEKEIALLKEHYRKGTRHRDIAAKLKRTLIAVESKAAELGLVSRRGKK